MAHLLYEFDLKSINVRENEEEKSPTLLKVNNNILLFNLVILTERPNFVENKKKIIFVGHGFKISIMVPFVNIKLWNHWTKNKILLA